MEWENHSEKKSDPKNRKNSKNQSEIAAWEQKTNCEKANFCSNTIFSLYFKFRAKKFQAAKPLAVSLHFLFRRDQNHYSNLTSKIMKMCEQILKKRQHPNTIKILWIVKKPRAPQYNFAHSFAAIKKRKGNKTEKRKAERKEKRKKSERNGEKKTETRHREERETQEKIDSDELCASPAF